MIITGLIVLAIAFIWTLTGLSKKLMTTEYTVCSSRLPDSFSGFTIAQLSDLHGKNLDGLTKTLKKRKPDLIVCTGDLFDGIKPAENTWKTLREVKKIAPVCFVSGNHEKYRPDWMELKNSLHRTGIIVLEDDLFEEFRNSSRIQIIGIEDPGRKEHLPYEQKVFNLHDSVMKVKKRLEKEQDAFRLVLFHRPNMADQLYELHPDLILSGHLHGGQWRFLGIGIAAPGNRTRLCLFPRRSGGKYQINDSTLIVSRGLGDQMKIPRIHNRPQLVIIRLEKGQDLKV